MVMRDRNDSTDTEVAEATELMSHQDGSTSTANDPLQMTTPQISVMAILALVLSVFGILLIPGIIGLILGTVALWQINRSEGRLLGREIALVAVVLSTVLLVYHMIFLGFAYATAGVAGYLIEAINGFFGTIAGWFE